MAKFILFTRVPFQLFSRRRRVDNIPCVLRKCNKAYNTVAQWWQELNRRWDTRTLRDISPNCLLIFYWTTTHLYFRIIFTVCTVVQNCCNGRSKKYRKWHFWGCSLLETLQRIDIKFGRDDYVGDGSQYAKWHINRFRGVISAKGWNVNGLCFFIFYFLFLVRFLAPLGVKPLDRFWRVIRQNACFWVSCIPFGVRTITSQF